MLCSHIACTILKIAFSSPGKVGEKVTFGTSSHFDLLAKLSQCVKFGILTTNLNTFHLTAALQCLRSVSSCFGHYNRSCLLISHAILYANKLPIDLDICIDRISLKFFTPISQIVAKAHARTNLVCSTRNCFCFNAVGYLGRLSVYRLTRNYCYNENARLFRMMRRHPIWW